LGEVTVDGRNPPWLSLPAAQEAAAEGRYGVLVRLARTAAGLTLDEAGRLAGYSAATLSRIERGRQPLTDVNVLHHLAVIFAIPPALFGLTAPNGPRTSRSTAVALDATTDRAKADRAASDRAKSERSMADRVAKHDGPVNEPGSAGAVSAAGRSCGGSAGLITAVPLGPGDMVDALVDVLLEAPDLIGGVATVAALRSSLAAARADYRACRYYQLARRLPWLLRTATATATATCDGASDERKITATLLIEVYNLAALFLLKLHENAMALATVDRALQAGRAIDDPVVSAETARLATVALRRSGHRRRAQQTAITAADRLAAATGLVKPLHGAWYGRLLATAAYTAAKADDRAAAWQLLDRAEEATRDSGVREPFCVADIGLYKIGIARALGDYGSAIDYARALDPDDLMAPNRRARYWQDTALALHARGRYADCQRALLAAERIAPQAVRLLPWAQRLTASLSSIENRSGSPSGFFDNTAEAA
jgi:transcriptional regulator with XRE-family HTH domain/tetratricopeptide (TPR) repeat protein